MNRFWTLVLSLSLVCCLCAKQNTLRKFVFTDIQANKKLELSELTRGKWEAKLVTNENIRILSSQKNKHIAFDPLFRDLQMSITEWKPVKSCKGGVSGKVEWTEVSQKAYSFCKSSMIDVARIQSLWSRISYLERNDE